MTADEVGHVLADADRPLVPNDEFARRLFDELFRDGPVVVRRDDVATDGGGGADAVGAEPRARRRGMVAAAAAAVVVIASVFGVGVLDGGGTEVEVRATPTEGRPRTTDVATEVAAAACRRFASTAFGDRTRAEVIGPSNATTFTGPEEVSEATSSLHVAYDRLVAELDAAGVDVARFAQPSDRIGQRLARAETFAGRGDTSTALQALGLTEELLMAVDRALTEQGLAGCL